MVGEKKCGGPWSRSIYYSNVQKTCGGARPGAAVAERNRGFPGMDNVIRNEGIVVTGQRTVSM